MSTLFVRCPWLSYRRGGSGTAHPSCYTPPSVSNWPSSSCRHVFWHRPSPSRLVPSATSYRVQLLDMSDRLVPYEEAWRLQKELVEAVCKMAPEDGAGAVILLQHLPVYTLGAGSTEGHLRFDPADSPLPLYRTERGGEVTYHGPGQLVMYPILNLRLFNPDLHWYLRSLEEVVIRSLEEVSGLAGERIPGLTGVWVGGAKVAAIGVRASRWVTYHGLALNVTADLAPFQQIVPCGISDRPVTSVQRLLGVESGGSSSGEGEGGSSWSTSACQGEQQVFGGQDENGGSSNASSSGGGLVLERLLQDWHEQQQQGDGEARQLLQEYRHGLLQAFEEVFGVELEQSEAAAAQTVFQVHLRPELGTAAGA